MEQPDQINVTLTVKACEAPDNGNIDTTYHYTPDKKYKYKYSSSCITVNKKTEISITLDDESADRFKVDKFEAIKLNNDLESPAQKEFSLQSKNKHDSQIVILDLDNVEANYSLIVYVTDNNSNSNPKPLIPCDPQVRNKPDLAKP